MAVVGQEGPRSRQEHAAVPGRRRRLESSEGQRVDRAAPRRPSGRGSRIDVSDAPRVRPPGPDAARRRSRGDPVRVRLDAPRPGLPQAPVEVDQPTWGELLEHPPAAATVGRDVEAAPGHPSPPEQAPVGEPDHDEPSAPVAHERAAVGARDLPTPREHRELAHAPGRVDAEEPCARVPHAEHDQRVAVGEPDVPDQGHVDRTASRAVGAQGRDGSRRGRRASLVREHPRSAVGPSDDPARPAQRDGAHDEQVLVQAVGRAAEPVGDPDRDGARELGAPEQLHARAPGERRGGAERAESERAGPRSHRGVHAPRTVGIARRFPPARRSSRARARLARAERLEGRA